MDPTPRFGCIMPYVSYPDSLYIGRLVERNGFDSLWFSDHVIGIGNVPALEQWSLSSVIAHETSGLDYGFATTHPYRSPPHILAQQIATTDTITDGSFICGIGAGESMNLAPYGIELDRPVSRMVETITLMKRLWTEETVDYEGEFWTYEDATLPLEPRQSPHPPLWIGGIGPRMQEITARVGDGWLPYMQTPDLYAEKLRNILDMRDGSEGEFGTGAYIPMGIAGDTETARERFGHIGQQVALLSPRTLAETGHEDLIVEDISLVEFTYDQQTGAELESAARDVPMDLAEDICVIGSPEDAVEQLEAFIDAGVTHFSLDLFGDLEVMQETIELAGEEVLPHFRMA